MEATRVNPGEGRSIRIGSIRLEVKEDGTHTRGAMAMAEFEIPPRAPAPPPHVHRAHEEGFYVLEGELEFVIGEERMGLAKGSFILVPVGVPHTFANVGDTPAKFLNTFTPPDYINYFDEMAALVASGPLDPKMAGEIMARYDTEMVTG